MAKQYKKPSENNSAAFAELTGLDATVPPQAVELEQAVLGALMLEKDAIIEVQ
jgi:replicative DNA helicase